MRLIILTSLVVLAACAPPKPPPATVTITAVADTVVASVVSIGNAVPLSDGRWAALALEEGRVELVDFAKHRADPFPGITKAEVPDPTVLLSVGDTIILGDWGLRRFTAWTVTGGRLAAWPVPDALRGAFPRARDAAGQWYFAVSPPAKPDGSTLLDSAAIVRSDAQLTRFDTLGRLAPPDLASVDAGSGPRFQRRALSGEDNWGVAPDGTLWIARVFQNQLEWHPPRGKVAQSAQLPDMVLPITPMDRQIFVRRFPEDQRDAAAQIPFEAIKPPFERVFQAPDGRMWLFKSDTALAATRTVQIVDQRDGLLMYLKIPTRGSALGLDANYIVMGEEFPGGIRILRFPVPPEAKARAGAP
ncbi:MAG TPA: hypothetical protein VHW65_07165 [Gemmatimonadales bacterium]|jgi:hypothetical protein|nr:hypothetical protein [Gemmatimonadales bacterium]